MAALADARLPPSLAPNVLAEVGLADRYARFDSPIGPLVVAWNGLGVSAVEAADDDATLRGAPPGPDRAPGTSASSGCPTRLAAAIARRLDGDRRVRIDLDLRGHTDFERDVWHKALEIPRGEVRPYGWIAAEIGRPKAVRAVGHGARAQPGAAHRAVPSGRPHGRHDRPVLARRAGEQADDPRGRGPRPAASWSGSRVRHPLHRLRHDQDRLPADLPPRPPGDRPPPARVPLDGRGPGARLPRLPGLPAGVGAIAA